MREIDGLPVYDITIDDAYSEGNDLGIEMIAFTDSPAIMTKGLAFNKVEKPLYFADDVKMRIAAPAMIPMDIYRADEDGEYYVSFSAKTIEQIHSKFMRNLKNKELFNLEHNEDAKVPAFVLESWIVDNPKQDKSYSTFGVEVPKGTLFIVAQVTDKDYYNDLVKEDRIGFSIEGFLGLKLNQIMKEENEEVERYELNGKFYEIKEGKLVPIALEEEVKEEEYAEEEKEEEMAEEVKEEEVKEEELETEVEAEVDAEADGEAILAVVAPALEALRTELMGAIADALNKETEEEVVEEEMSQVELSSHQKLSHFMSQTRN